MRIAYMLTSLGIGGAERQVIALAERMAARGHDVALIVLRDRAHREWTTSVPLVLLEMTKSPSGVIRGLMRANQLLRRLKPDILHSHTFPANVVARLSCGTGAAPIAISTIHNVYEGGRARTLAYRLTERWSAHTTTVAKAIAERYISMGAASKQKCSVIRNGIDVTRFSPDHACGASNRHVMNAEADFVWLAAGRITAAKDYATLIRAFSRVLSSTRQAQLWIAGESKNGEEADLQRLAQKLGITKRVQWLGHCEDMTNLLSAGDGFVSSSAWEGMPLVLGEAMAMEKPVVATDVGGVRELVGDAGIIVPARDPDALAHAMLRVMQTPSEERRTMGKLARQRICHEFDLDAKADEWLALYSRLMSDRRSRAAAERVLT